MKVVVIVAAISFLLFAFSEYDHKSSPVDVKKNVLLISVDDLNDWIGIMDTHPDVLTPNIDRLAKQGILFTNAYAQAPVCGPSRASLMTGLLPSTSGIYYQVEDRDIKGSNEATKASIFLPDYFENNGYKSMGIGKIFHKGDRAGVFDEYGGRFEYYGPYPEERMNYSPSDYNRPGGTSTDWGPYPNADSLMPDYKYAEWTVEKLKQDHEKPFFMATGFIRPHVPWHVPQRWYDKFDPDTLATPAYNRNDFSDIPEMGSRVAEVPMMPTTEQLIDENSWQEVIQAYLASIAFVDHQIGKVVRALENSQYADNTIVVLWGDHGYHLGEKNRFAKQALWDRSLNTPVIFSGPDINSKKKSSAPVGLVDIYPTLLELAGLPKNNLNDGHSLVPLLKETNFYWPHYALSTFGRRNHSVFSERYHLIRYEDGSKELYDLKYDRHEWNNIAERADKQQIIDRLERQIPEDPVPLYSKSNIGINEYHRNKSKK